MLIKDLNKIILKYQHFLTPREVPRKFNKIFSGRSLSTIKVPKEDPNDVIIKSPLPSLEYPKVSIDQFIWTNVDKWMNKVALVR